MSNFLAPSQGFQAGLFVAVDKDQRIAPRSFRWAPAREQKSPWDDGLLWSSSRSMGGSWGFSHDAATDGVWGSELAEESGGQTMLKITGTTKDSAGAALASCIVQGFLTATDLYVREVISDLAGYYEFFTQYAGAMHYLVAYKAGSPDVAGTTVNTLVPA